RVMGEVAGVRTMVGPVLVSGQLVEGMGFSFQRTTGPDGTPSAAIVLSISRKTNLDFRAVESIFRRSWRSPQTSRRSPDTNHQPPTRPHGNAEIVYSTAQGTISWRAEFIFEHNAELSFARFSTAGTP